MNWLQRILRGPVLWLSDRFSSKPDRERVFKALTDLLDCILKGEKKKGLVVPFKKETGKFIIFSDQHKGRRNGADDFMLCEPNYLKALEYYHQNGFHYIDLGDSEELWENTFLSVKKKQGPSFRKESKFISANAFIKVFGNHDLLWQNDPLAPIYLKSIYGMTVPIYEGVVLQTTVEGKRLNIFCTHGHQGDKVSDGNWFSKFFISKIWAPLQAFLKINPNTPAYDNRLKTLHNSIMYQWSAAQKDLLLITGHTHQPLFESLTHIERLYRQLLFARKQGDESMIATLQKEIEARKFTYDHISDDYLSLRPTYFNSGCCCFSDGDITGIEISEGVLRLIKWTSKKGHPDRVILEEAPLEELMGITNNSNDEFF
ncbi:metallophosphoesterase [Chitinophagaceae bacterium LB-8]|uniref:Metallophosphoesterase n=1 Tax=Paraflavisolibacter caeni TaxID=2982496 RepID=A0A9X2XPX0_9BACT|nr:metallophosphoesterase [Paraflavisolibacter caeni]MCU7552029.1 metallophosphoesterase [Paraflavisolibacter caeni]